VRAGGGGERGDGRAHKSSARSSRNGQPMVADVNRMALLGREPAEKACGVDEGDEECERQTQLQQTNLHCEENCQHNGNANEDIPDAQRVLLEGEWAICASGKSRDSTGDANVSNTAVEHADGSGESNETEITKEVESRGCEGGTCQSCMADRNAGRAVEREDALNELTQLLTMSIESESPDGGEILCICLGGTNWHAGDVNRPQNDTDESRELTDGLRTSDRAETDGMSHGDSAGTYLSVGDAKRDIHATDGVGSHADASSGHSDVSTVETDAITTKNAPDVVSIPRKRLKLPDSPMETARWRPDEPNGCGNHADGSSVHAGVQRVGNDAETAANETENIRMCQTERKTENSPEMRKIATHKPTSRRKRVSVEGIDVHVPWNAPFEASSTTSPVIVFGRVTSGDEATAVRDVEGKTAGNGDGDGDDDGKDGIVSSSTVDPMRVEGV